MKPHYEKQLETSIQRELDTLGELPAPPALANRILRVIEQRQTVPWYQRAWSAWPLGLRLASLAILLGVFSGLCFGVWELTRTVATMETTSDWFASAQALWRTAGALLSVVSSFADRLSPSIIVTAFALLFTVCAACLGLASACFRLVMRSDSNSILS